LYLGVGAIVAAVVALSGVITRVKSEADLKTWTHERAIPTVMLVNPEHSSADQSLVLPGDIQAWYAAPLHARVSGYVKMWYKDIGAKVKAGDVLADIDTPDLDQQLDQAKGELEKAKADAALAEITANRWEALQKSNAVSQQVTDEKAGDYQARLAEVAAAKANLGHLSALEEFKHLVAPFDGVVTARNIDVGALVHDGTQANSTELFEVADVHELRIYADVPQSYAADIRPGMVADLKVSQYPDRVFQATVATTSDAINQKSRTLQVELHRDKKDGMLQPGSFAEVHFNLPPDPNSLELPASALIFRGTKVEVAVIGPDNRVTLKPIEVGRDLGTTIEIRSGLTATDRVIRNPSDSLSDGDLVRIAGQTGQKEDASQISAR
jgi:RND family efflux transporter MFP subunit